MYIKFWGTRESIPAPGRKTVKYGGNTPCIELRTDNHLLILEAGSGIRELGNHLLEEYKKKSIVGHIFLSHAHWDHIQGIPFFAPAYVLKNKFTIYGPYGTEFGIGNLLKRQMEKDYFPIPFTKMKADINFVELKKELFLNYTKIEFCNINHSGVACAYKVTQNEKVVAYTGDNEPNFHKVNEDINNDKKIDVITEVDNGLIEFIKDADVVICDSQYTPEEYKNLRVGWGHSSYVDAVNIALKGNVKQLVLFHHDPAHTDDFIDEIVSKARNILKEKKSKIICFGAKEGMVIKL